MQVKCSLIFFHLVSVGKGNLPMYMPSATVGLIKTNVNYYLRAPPPRLYYLTCHIHILLEFN
jgi:hypothetical protein